MSYNNTATDANINTLSLLILINKFPARITLKGCNVQIKKHEHPIILPQYNKCEEVLHHGRLSIHLW